MRKLTFIIVFFISTSLFSQVEIDWLKLRDVYYKSEYAEDMYGYVQIPYFGEAVEPLDNKEVKITGYMRRHLSSPIDIYICSDHMRGRTWICSMIHEPLRQSIL